jgi:hypothetical protein
VELRHSSFVSWRSISTRFRNTRWSPLFQKFAAVVLVVIVAATAIGWGRYQVVAMRPQARLPEPPAPRITGASMTPSLGAIAGRWMATRVASPIGPVKIELVLRPDGSCHINAWTTGPLTARLKDANGTYAIRGGRLCSHLLKTGSCPFVLDDGNLLVEYKPGQIVTFHRETIARALQPDRAGNLLTAPRGAGEA